MTAGEAATSGVRIVQLEPQLAAVVRKTVPLSGMAEAQRAARPALAAALRAARAGRPDDRALTIWRPPEAGSIDYAPGVLVADELEVSGDVSLFTLPAGRAAHLRMTGPYDGLPGAWQRVFHHCAGKGLALAGLNWEVYAAPGEPSEMDLYALLA